MMTELPPLGEPLDGDSPLTTGAVPDIEIASLTDIGGRGWDAGTAADAAASADMVVEGATASAGWP
jgi:hypothetical protein